MKKLFLIIPVIIFILSSFYLLENDSNFRSDIRNLLVDSGLKEPVIRPYSPSDNIPIVYHAVYTNVEIINPNLNSNKFNDLPDSLIIPSGDYRFEGKIYALDDEGLYRFISPLNNNAQRIVFDGKNINALMSAVSWIYSHGNSDSTKTFEEINSKALNSKIFGTCGKISVWIQKILESHNIKSRIVQTLTLDQWNTYDNGHTMIEIYREDLNQWVLYDLDNNLYFSRNNEPLSLFDFMDAVSENSYEMNFLASDTTLDISNFKSDEGYDYAFYAESVYSSDDTLKKWYSRVIQVPMISEDKFSYFTTDTEEKRQRMESYASHHKFLTNSEFLSKFY